ncbi:hypothetical protein [Burkholderia pseudomallei]|uniref:hypothetical protein n=1 Tax=Burkholderia pseudomallei TaxID=28450 RepID=UPI00117790BA|nr:hypothetical protein [Burkholderia pseudomallei]
MNEKNHGGPAFPIPLAEGQAYQGHAPCDGMTLLDYFEAKAMQGYCSREDSIEQEMDDIAADAYAIAYAMLHARGAA